MSGAGAAGGIYSQSFLEAVKPLYDLHMGTENMGPLLYTLLRFLKPMRVASPNHTHITP